MYIYIYNIITCDYTRKKRENVVVGLNVVGQKLHWVTVISLLQWQSNVRSTSVQVTCLVFIGRQLDGYRKNLDGQCNVEITVTPCTFCRTTFTLTAPSFAYFVVQSAVIPQVFLNYIHRSIYRLHSCILEMDELLNMMDTHSIQPILFSL